MILYENPTKTGHSWCHRHFYPQTPKPTIIPSTLKSIQASNEWFAGGATILPLPGHGGPSDKARLVLEGAEQRAADRRHHRGQAPRRQRRAAHAEQPPPRTDPIAGSSSFETCTYIFYSLPLHSVASFEPKKYAKKSRFFLVNWLRDGDDYQ